MIGGCVAIIMELHGWVYGRVFMRDGRTMSGVDRKRVEDAKADTLSIIKRHLASPGGADAPIPPLAERLLDIKVKR